MRYSGKLGLAEQTEIRPGVWEETITERPVVGTVETRTETLDQGDEILPRYRTTTAVSVLALGVGPQDNSMIRYVTHVGKRWNIGSIADKPPRLTIYIGEEYHGPYPTQLIEHLEAVTSVTKAYLQPPTSGMVTPYIIAEASAPNHVSFADNIKYMFKNAYTIIVVDRAPDSLIRDQVEALPHSRFDRGYRVNGLHHFAYQLFY